MKRWAINLSSGLVGIALGWAVRSDPAAHVKLPARVAARRATVPAPPLLGRKRRAPAAPDATAAAGFEARANREFPVGHPVDETRLRVFIEEWLADDPAKALRYFSDPEGALAPQAPLFMQVLTRHDPALAVETLRGWPGSLREKELHQSNAADVCARVLGQTAPEQWLARLSELGLASETGAAATADGRRIATRNTSPVSQFFRGWASRDALASLAAAAQYSPKPALYEVCHGVPPGQRRAVLDWAVATDPVEAAKIIPFLAYQYAKQDPEGARAFHESLPDALANEDRILETLGQGIVGAAGGTGTVDLAGIPAALGWIDQAFPPGAQQREGVLRMLAAQLTEEPGGVQALISRTTDTQWAGREDAIRRQIEWSGSGDPSEMYAWLSTLDGPSRSAQLGAVWARRSPDELVSVALAHPDDAGLREAALSAAAALGVRNELLAEHPELVQ